ncbi:MAG: serine recombinase [Harvfovirus sp.]|uniref:Serine recombinase n=1 Tax=Harvfovirus sp. TaxID=2487768 RepID=A0A3G5A0V2_9VIRU|nr:MAG: serine recombinase [Harvfovirus sp.]
MSQLGAIYCRKSSVGKYAIKELSLNVQNDVCKEYCVKNNISVQEDMRIAETVSAREMSKMVELEKLIKKLGENAVLVVSNVSRFSRNVQQAIPVLELLRKNNIFVHSVNDNCRYDNDFNNRHHFRQMLSQAEFESDQISDRANKSIESRRKKGCKIGKSRFGYESFYDKNGLRRERENKAEQLVLELLTVYKERGHSARECAIFLNEKNCTFRKKEWNAVRVNYVLRSVDSGGEKKELGGV